MNDIQEHSNVRIALLGAAGRMGRVIMETAGDYPGVYISAALVSLDSSLVGQAVGKTHYSADLHYALTVSDVLVDFSTSQATAQAVDVCRGIGKPLVIGVTGFSVELMGNIRAASHDIALLVAPNMSLGATLLQRLTGIAARALSADYRVEITDVHHRHKQDAPSGTATALGEAVAAARGVSLEKHAVYTRAGHTEPRRPGSIGFTSVRRDEVVGDHGVVFESSVESLELTHHAHKREAFALGALAAARWISRQPPGLYAMADVLGLPAL
ncbi:MAG: 4-hydroxy-tetrahydrodipicolinate reductase [Gammaproteobacteria bacterium]